MRKFWNLITSHPLSLLGATITTAAAGVFLSFFALAAFGSELGPYSGILAFAVMPAALAAGLALIPLGIWLRRRKERREGIDKPAFPVVDLNKAKVRDVAVLFAGLTVVNFGILGVGSYQAVHTMDSTQFCGTACHSVMEPEYATYKRSPHQNVKCVSCHIGPGADWFVKSKLSGSWQLVSVALDLYPRPIPTPVHNLRPARDTCEQCHWPSKFVGDRLKVITHFAEDEYNTEKKSVLLMKVGGMQGRESMGIHWHVDPGNQIRYRSDEKRERIGTVELTRADGSQELFELPADHEVSKETAAAPWRTMDCIDCHNRPTHIYRLPHDELDAALTAGTIDRTLPYIRREGLKALKGQYASRDAAQRGIGDALRAAYAERGITLSSAQTAALGHAGETLSEIWGRNVFPQMNIGWGTYPSHLGHENAPGCFRCHDDEHQTAAGRTISGDCAICHSVLAMEEENPPILAELNP